MKLNDLTGQKFGRLTVLYRDGDISPVRWICRCECGNEKSIRTQHLISSNTVSCGCYNRENLRQPKNHAAKIGERCGKLTVISNAGVKDSECIWLCRCDCGGTITVTSGGLTTGNVTSCGCVLTANRKDVYKNTESFIRDGTNYKLISRKQPNANNKTGVRGVWYDGKTNRYIAYISFKKARYTLGRFANIEDAIKAREAAEEKLFSEALNDYE